MSTLHDNWYGRARRKLFFDFHTHSATTGVASAFNAAHWADQLKKAQAQAVSVFVKCGWGWSYYRKGTYRYVHPNLPAGLDMVAEQIAALHKRKLKAIGYYHTFNSEPIAKEHPEWLWCNMEGQTNPQFACCLISPLTDKWLLPQLEEFVRNYAIDAMFFDGACAGEPCYCQSCQQTFQQETGQAMPREKTSPEWKSFLRWRLIRYQQIRHMICDAIHRVRPEAVVSFNWAYGLQRPEIVPDEVGSLMGDFSPADQAFSGSFHAKYWSTQGKPFDLMNTAFLQWWGDWACKPALAMQREAAAILANGGCVWTGYQMTPSYEVPPAVMRELGRTMTFIKTRERFLDGAEPVPNVAVLWSTSNSIHEDNGSWAIPCSSIEGLHKMLIETGWPYHFVNERDLAARLQEYRVVILPNQRYLSADFAQALRGYVAQGGVLIATGLTGTLDDNFNPRPDFILDDLLGVTFEKVYEKNMAYLKVINRRLKAGALDMPHMMETTTVFARPVSSRTQVLAALRKPYLRSDGKYLLASSPVGADAGYPAITLQKTGRGTAVYIASDIFGAYQARNQWNLKRIFNNLLNLLIKDKLVKVVTPLWLEVVMTRQGCKTIVHLVNHHCNLPPIKGNVCAEEVPIIRDVIIKLRVAAKPSRVTIEPGQIKPIWKYNSKVITVRMPPVNLHAMVVVQD